MMLGLTNTWLLNWNLLVKASIPKIPYHPWKRDVGISLDPTSSLKKRCGWQVFVSNKLDVGLFLYIVLEIKIDCEFVMSCESP